MERKNNVPSRSKYFCASEHGSGETTSRKSLETIVIRRHTLQIQFLSLIRWFSVSVFNVFSFSEHMVILIEQKKNQGKSGVKKGHTK